MRVHVYFLYTFIIYFEIKKKKRNIVVGLEDKTWLINQNKGCGSKPGAHIFNKTWLSKNKIKKSLILCHNYP